MTVRVWVLCRFKWYGVPDMGIVSKKVWQSKYAGLDKRHIEYITESTNKKMLEQMKELAKEK